MLDNTDDIDDMEEKHFAMAEAAVTEVFNGLLTLLAIQDCEPVTNAMEEEIVKRFLEFAKNNPQVGSFNEKNIKNFPKVLNGLSSKLELIMSESSLEGSDFIN